MNTPTSPTPGSFSTDRLGEESGHPLGRKEFWLRGWSLAKGKRVSGGSSLNSLQNMGFPLGWGENLGSFLLGLGAGPRILRTWFRTGRPRADDTVFPILD